MKFSLLRLSVVIEIQLKFLLNLGNWLIYKL